jgi:outer membrane receptor for ferrienterochelin and colicin
MNRLPAFILFFFFTLFTILQASSTGKIAGRITDKNNDEPLITANVLIKDFQLGDATDMDGYYMILNVPPGKYTLVVMYIGYRTVEVSEVNVSIDLTTEINVAMTSETIESSETIQVIAERPVIQKDLTATTAVVSGDEIAVLPITEIKEILEVQAGYVDGHVRGGRKGEIAYWIDGIPVTDAYDGENVVEVNKDMVQELQFISGAFNAEYGNAMSGIVNIATREGDNRFGGQYTTYIGDYFSNHKKIFWGIDKVNPTAIHNFEGSLHGPVIKDKLFFDVSGRYIYFDGWYYGRRMFNPQAIGGLIPTEDFSRDYWYVLGSDPDVDRFIVSDLFGESDPVVIDSLANIITMNHKNGKGDGKYVPMNWSKKHYGQAKFSYRFTDLLKLSSNTIFDKVDYRDYDRAYSLNPDGDLNRHRMGITQIVKLSHVLSQTTFYDLGLTYFYKIYHEYVYKDRNDPRYIHPFGITKLDNYSFNAGGTNNHRFKRITNTYLAKFDLTSQLNRVHQLKTGIEFKTHNLYYSNIDLRPPTQQTSLDIVYDSPYINPVAEPDSTIYSSHYTRKPFEFSAYIQDKMEFSDFILNIGVRFDYFDPDGKILADPSDPEIYNPIRPENRFHDLNDNGIQDPGEPSVILTERQQYWYKKVKPKYQFSPRVGAAFPISTRGKIYFSYGFFFQRPKFELLYTNPDFDMLIGETPLIGNADLKAEKTISGELGIQQEVMSDLSVDMTIYFRDIRELTGTRADFITIFGGSRSYAQYTNSDFGLIKGFIVALNKRFSNNYTARLDYTYQVAEGTASEPADAQKAVDGGALPEVQLIPLSWDQRHTLNFSLSYSRESWGFSILSRFGSGLPYTPRKTQDISSILTNSSFKPPTYEVDVRAYKDLFFGKQRFTLFLRVFNLLDQLNEVNVFDDTGRADETIDKKNAEDTVNPFIQRYNTIDQWFTDATHYAEPRRVELGLTYYLN